MGSRMIETRPSHDRWRAAIRALEQYRQRDPREPLEAFLEANEGLRDLIEPILASAGVTTVTRASRGGEPPSLDHALASLRPLPERIGRYRVLRVLGRGGFGIVYLAEQEEPIYRRVAIKVVRLGMETPGAITRFDAERQALAVLEHPNIARVFEAGATEEGRPYFVMEYVQGKPIHRFCEETRCSVDERLRLFRSVCAGVQHAHQKGIIHRDLKPSNILVTVRDKRPVPKIIDFGVAKMVEDERDTSLVTQIGEVVGTPEYMSPEQASGRSSADLDTRTDIYALGVLLYELLVGVLPFERLGFGVGLDQLLRNIRDDEPPRPSSRLEKLDSAAEVAEGRRASVRSLLRRIRGDLDWITLKAIEKDRTRRYATASELAADVGRFLRHEPVTASPPTLGYRMRKFVRRHRVGVIAAGTTAAALVVGMVATGLALDEARDQRRIALQESDEANHAREEAERQEAWAKAAAERAIKVRDFLRWVLAPTNDPEFTADTTLVEILARAARELGTRFPDEPEIKAELHATLGDAFTKLGAIPEATAQFARGLELCRALGPDSAATARALEDLARCHIEAFRIDEAARLLEESLELRVALEGAEGLATASTYDSLGMLHQKSRQFDEAEEQYRKCVRIRTRELGPDDPSTLEVMNNLAALHNQRGEIAQAAELFERVREGRTRALGERHVDTQVARINLATVRVQQNRLEEADALFEDARAVLVERYGEEHPWVLAILYNQAVVRFEQDRLDEALALHLRALEGRRRVRGPHHPETVNSLIWSGNVHRIRGDLDAAVEAYREALRGARHSFDERDPRLWVVLARLGETFHQQRELDQAEPLLRELYERTRDFHGPAHQDTEARRRLLVNLYSDMMSVAKRRRDEGRPDAHEALRDVVLRAREALGLNWRVVPFREELARAYREDGMLEEAEREYLQCLQELDDLGIEHRSRPLRRVASQLADLYDARGLRDRAEDIRERYLSRR